MENVVGRASLPNVLSHLRSHPSQGSCHFVTEGNKVVTRLADRKPEGLLPECHPEVDVTRTTALS